MRRALTNWFQALYFERLRIYKPHQPPPIDNCDQRMTEDIKNVSDAFLPLFHTFLFQPVFIVYYMNQASLELNWAPYPIIGHFLLTFILHRFFMNPTLRYSAAREKTDADFRFTHMMASNHAEAIAITGGGLVIKKDADEKFEKSMIVQKRLNIIGTFREGVSSLCGYTNSFWAYCIILASAAAGKSFEGLDHSEVTSKVSRMSYILLEVFMKFNSFNTLCTFIPNKSASAFRLIEMTRRLEDTTDLTDEPKGNEMQEILVTNPVSAAFAAAVAKRRPSASGSETVFVNFDNVDLYCPNEQLLVYGFNLRIWPGQNTIIYGPSGNAVISIYRN